MADRHRLNTFIPVETFKAVKIVAAELGVPLHVAVAGLLQLGLQSHKQADNFLVHEAEIEILQKDRELEMGVIPQSSRQEPDPNEIVRCGLCGQEMPQSAKAIHEENCLRSQQGYWDRKAFSV